MKQDGISAHNPAPASAQALFDGMTDAGRKFAEDVIAALSAQHGADNVEMMFLRDEQINYDPAAVEKVLKKNDGEGRAMLKSLRELFNGIQDWTAATLEAAVNEYVTVKQLKLNQIAQPLRVALSGNTISPPIFQSLEFLGKPATIARIDRCLVKIASLPYLAPGMPGAM